MDSKPARYFALSANTRLLIVRGVLCAKHAKMSEPVPIDLKQLERWILRQLRELVS